MIYRSKLSTIDDSLPSYICIPSQNAQDDDCSQISLPRLDNKRPSQATDFGIKLAADPYFYYTLDRGTHTDDMQQELINLKLQIARQQEKIDLLSARLDQTMVENETLNAEKTSLANELSKKSQEQQVHQQTTRRWSSAEEVKPTNNACQQVVAEVMRKSFQTYIKDSRRQSLADKQAIKRLEEENRALRQSLVLPEEKVFRGAGTVRTASETLDISDNSSWLISPEEEDNDEVAEVDLSSFNERASCRTPTKGTKNVCASYDEPLKQKFANIKRRNVVVAYAA